MARKRWKDRTLAGKLLHLHPVALAAQAVDRAPNVLHNVLRHNPKKVEQLLKKYAIAAAPTPSTLALAAVKHGEEFVQDMHDIYTDGYGGTESKDGKGWAKFKKAVGGVVSSLGPGGALVAGALGLNKDKKGKAESNGAIQLPPPPPDEDDKKKKQQKLFMYIGIGAAVVVLAIVVIVAATRGNKSK